MPARALKRPPQAQVKAPAPGAQPTNSSAPTASSASNQRLQPLAPVQAEEGYASYGYQPAAFSPLRPAEEPVSTKAEALPTAEEQVADELAGVLSSLVVDLEKLFRLLTDHTEAFSQGMEAALKRRHAIDLRTWLKQHLTGDARVKAFAMLHFKRWHTPATQMALALIAGGIRDQEILRILYSRNLATRRLLEQEYNKAFCQLGTGALRSDLKAAFNWDVSDWIWQKAWVLLERDLTAADELFFDSVAILGVHGDAVVSRLQAELDKGWASFDKMVQDWAPLQAAGWAKADMESSLLDELTYEVGANKAIVKAIFAQYHAYKGAKAAAVKAGKTDASPEEQATFTANAALGVAEAASDGAGTAEAPLFQAALQLFRVRTAPILAAEAKDQPTDAAWNAWVKERDQFLATIRGSEMREGGADYAKIRTMLLHDPRQKRKAEQSDRLEAGEENQTLADQIHLARENNEFQTITSLIIKAWATGQLDQLRTDLLKGKQTEGQQIRPPLYLHLLARPYHIGLVEPGRSDELRGAYQLRVEFSRGSSDTQVQEVYKLLQTPGVTDELRQKVITEFAKLQLGGYPGKTPLERFFNYLHKEYEGAPSIYKLERLLKPKLSEKERLENQRKERIATKPNAVTGAVVDVVNAFTHNDQMQVEAESYEQAEYAVNNPAEAQWMAQHLGTTEVGKDRLDEHEAALNQANELKHQVVEVGATAIELVVATALTFVTAGTSLAFLPGIVSSLAGMGVRELALGDEYELKSDQNAGKLMGALASAAGGIMIDRGFGSLVKPEFWDEVANAKQIAGRFDLVKSSIKSVTQGALKHAANPSNALSADQLANVLAEAIAGVALDKLADPVKERFKRAGSILREHYQPAFVGGVITGAGGKLVEWAQKGTGGKSYGELATELAGVLPDAAKDALKETAGELGKARRKETGPDSIVLPKPPIPTPVAAPPAPPAAPPAAATAALAAPAGQAQPATVAEPAPATKTAPVEEPAPAPKVAPVEEPALAPKTAPVEELAPAPETAPVEAPAPTPKNASEASAAAPVSSAVANRRAQALDEGPGAPAPAAPVSDGLTAKQRRKLAIKANNAKLAKGRASQVAANQRYAEARARSQEAQKSAEERRWEYYQSLTAKIEQVDVSTKENTAIFYSGPGNRDRAEAFAEQNGKMTLEKTSGGKWLDSLKLFEKESPLTKEQAFQLWSRLSQRYAEGAKGTVIGFVEGHRSTGVFATTEEPALKRNSNVTNLITFGH